MRAPYCRLGYSPVNETPPCESPNPYCPFLENCPLRAATEIFVGFSDYDIVEVSMEANIEVPRGARMYDSTYEEAWG